MISSISSVNRNVEMENRSHEPEDLSLPVGSQKSYCYARQVRVKQRKNAIKAQDSELSMSSAKNVSIIHIVVWNNVVKLRASSCKRNIKLTSVFCFFYTVVRWLRFPVFNVYLSREKEFVVFSVQLLKHFYLKLAYA